MTLTNEEMRKIADMVREDMAKGDMMRKGMKELPLGFILETTMANDRIPWDKMENSVVYFKDGERADIGPSSVNRFAVNVPRLGWGMEIGLARVGEGGHRSYKVPFAWAYTSPPYFMKYTFGWHHMDDESGVVKLAIQFMIYAKSAIYSVIDLINKIPGLGNVGKNLPNLTWYKFRIPSFGWVTSYDTTSFIYWWMFGAERKFTYIAIGPTGESQFPFEEDSNEVEVTPE